MGVDSIRFPLTPPSPAGGEGIIIFNVILGIDVLTFGIHLNFGI